MSRNEPNLIVDHSGSLDLLGDADRDIAQDSREYLIPPGDARDAVERMHRTVEAAYAATDPGDLRVIHCDLWHDNIKLHNGIATEKTSISTVYGNAAVHVHTIRRPRRSCHACRHCRDARDVPDWFP